MGIFTPTRVLMGGTDSVVYCQATVQEMFKEYLYKGLLIWLNDLLGYAASEDGLIKLLRGVLKICATNGLKLDPSKCSFYLRGAKWCGRVISKSDVHHDPARISALQELHPPITGQDLLQFVCALGWMCMSVSGHNRLTQPLVDLMEQVYQVAGERTKRHVAPVQLVDVGWTTVHSDCLKACKDALGHCEELSHIPADHKSRIFSEQHHEPLMFLGGTFSGSAKAWAIVEKGAYAIIATCTRADYLLHRPGGFTLHMDHRNLRFTFNPSSALTAVPKYTADKLQRWAILLMAYEYAICDISGEDNVWADLLSRWGSKLTSICAVRLVPYEYSPTLNVDFMWPTMPEIRQCQQEAPRPIEIAVQLDDSGILLVAAGQVWIPPAAASLQLRICIVGHVSVAGHRGLETTLAALQQRFWWNDLPADATYFVRHCLHCMSVVGGPPVPRPLGEAMHADRPNELIHWDYLYMGASSTNDKYILVIKGDASKFVWFFAVPDATADTTYNCLMEWFAVFGVCLTWVSDQGTHFKNEVIQAL
ncbi:hypothetical protein PC129_g9257 [Phytophthora cactorum]|uniref:Integrase catalytic domain-containing protein n=2 Tax=Phytophthora cactorum TaxID=29920 RepID=A0A8T1I9X7_9STRA|nr:hypothetical protein PC112_g7824 [Phytophthora cactorum]KAG2830870.1 hypothetical protein PC111_g7205 [Phytophthora cactorum]KAG2914837.1 hypothetical protein PC114_g8017 [Phytophthora cactorum]KAG2983629.1 hypothetical protein PC118_g9313 [Phytophthora cactorum]KAG3026841.1 hypothetical protein PC119_g7617 [Phytophthora cactorum]